ncbi:MAG: PDZ domain-containing protein [Verrucomicrobiota bacterium]
MSGIQPIRTAVVLTFVASTVSLSAESEPEEKGITYLGVSTFDVSPSLREHLEIAEGFGIQIHEVAGDSPAETSGLKKNDILLKYGEQKLISPEHLSLLVRSDTPDSTIQLTLIRRGAEENVKVVLGEIKRTTPAVRPRPDPSRMSPEQWQKQLKEQQDYWHRWMEKRQQSPKGEKSGLEAEKSPPKATGRPPAVSMNPGFPVRVFGTDGVIKIDNDEGEVSITQEGEGHQIVIKDSEGRDVYAGTYDADLGIDGLPEEAQSHLEKMKLNNLEILAPRKVERMPEKTSAPMPPLEDSVDKEML